MKRTLVFLLMVGCNPQVPSPKTPEVLTSLRECLFVKSLPTRQDIGLERIPNVHWDEPLNKHSFCPR